VSKKDYLCT